MLILQTMKEGYYINKKDGRRSYLNANTVKILGKNLLKEWYLEGDVPLEAIPSEAKTKEVPLEIQEIIFHEEEKPERKSIKELKEVISDLTLVELKDYENDERVTVRKMVEEELKSRKYDIYPE